MSSLIPFSWIREAISLHLKHPIMLLPQPVAWAIYVVLVTGPVIINLDVYSDRDSVFVMFAISMLVIAMSLLVVLILAERFYSNVPGQKNSLLAKTASVSVKSILVYGILAVFFKILTSIPLLLISLVTAIPFVELWPVFDANIGAWGIAFFFSPNVLFLIDWPGNAITSFILEVIVAIWIGFWLIRFIFAFPALVNGAGPLSAIKQSWHMTKGHYVGLLFFSLIWVGGYWLLDAILSRVVMSLLGYGFMSRIAFATLTFVFSQLSLAILVIGYHKLKEAHSANQVNSSSATQTAL